MEIFSQLMFLSSVFLCAVIVGVVSWMGSKEKSYEEALEETKKSSSKASPSGSKKKQSSASLKGGKASSSSSSSSKVSQSKKKEEVVVPVLSEVSEPKKKLVVVEEELLIAEESSPKEEAPITLAAPKTAPKKSKKSPSSSKDKKKAAKGGVDALLGSSSSSVSVRELLSLVERTAMDEGECQHLIDVLLTKQVGGESGGASWVLHPGSNPSSLKSLQKDLADRESRLEESEGRVKSLSDKLGQLRAELNAATILSNNSSRLLEEMRNKHEKERSTLVASHTHQMETRSRECSSLQSRLTAQLSLTAQLEEKLSQIAPGESDDANSLLVKEMEGLKSEKVALEATIAPLNTEIMTLRVGEKDLQEKLSAKDSDEVLRLKTLQEEMDELRTSLAKASSQTADQAEELHNKQQELTQIKVESELKASDLSSSLEKTQKVLQEKEAYVSKLVEETERLSEQLASSVERPRAEGREDNGDMDVMQEVVTSWKNKYSSIAQEKDELVQKHEQSLGSLEAEMEATRSANDEVSRDLEGQRAKNNELREKNWKAMEALKEAELKLVSQQQQSSSGSEVQEKFLEKQRTLLKRLVPSVRLPSTCDEDAWVGIFEEEFSKAQSTSSSEATSAIGKLEERVSHYQSILSETENMLHQLESSVESEEGHWKVRLNEKEREISELKRERDRLSDKNSALDESINVVKQAEEMQDKLQELHLKLGSEEKEKKELLSRISKLSALENENTKLSEELSCLKSTNRSMGERIVKMDHIMSTGQEALQHEQRTVLVMRDQIQNLHKNTNEAHLENGLNGKASTTNGNNNDAAELNGGGGGGGVNSLTGSQESLTKTKKKKKKSKKDSQKV